MSENILKENLKNPFSYPQLLRADFLNLKQKRGLDELLSSMSINEYENRINLFIKKFEILDSKQLFNFLVQENILDERVSLYCCDGGSETYSRKEYDYWIEQLSKSYSQRDNSFNNPLICCGDCDGLEIEDIQDLKRIKFITRYKKNKKNT